MPRTPKEPQKSSPPKAAAVEKNHQPPGGEGLQALLQAARGDLMRAQRDLESVRLEQVEQKRRSAQHALVHAAELKEARSERDQLRMQLDALRGELALRGEPAAAKKKRHDSQDDARVATLEDELGSLRAELSEVRAALSDSQRSLSDAQAALSEARKPARPPAPDPELPRLRAELAKLHAAWAEAQTALADARRELADRSRAPAPAAVAAPPPAPVVVAASAQPSAAAVQPRGFFSKLFGRRPPADAR